MSDINAFEFSLTNATADIVKIDVAKNELQHFVDPWGRNSSSTPDHVHTLNTVLINNQLMAFLESNMYKQDFEKLVAVVG